MKRILSAALLVCLATAAGMGQELPPNTPVPSTPIAVPAGVLLGDQTGNALYLLDPATGMSETLIRGAGAGRWIGLDPDGQRFGFKFISPNGMQAPAIYDITSRTFTSLASPTRRAGQVSFSRTGRMAFTLEEELVIRGPDGERRFTIGSYANCAPISPDGLRAAFNDDDDRIWVIDLTTGDRSPVTPGGSGYFHPQWSPDGTRLLCSRLDGDLLVADLSAGTTLSLGAGENPVWSPDGGSIAFVRKEVVRGELRNSDLFAADPASGLVTSLTSTPALNEFDPSYSPDGSSLLYRTSNPARVVIQGLSDRKLPAPLSVPQEIDVTLPALPARQGPLYRTGGTGALDIPYVNQVYDTPDWFNGHAACGPTTSIMLLAYWNVLPEWETYCSWPSYHVNRWGNYVSERYNFRWFDYGLPANDPNGRPAQGGYGFMWTGSFSPHSRMVGYYNQHGIAAAMTDAPSHSTAIGKIAAAPYSLCNGLTTSGHIVLAHGLGAESHTIVVNDPYGDKNRTDLGYPNTVGKNAQYDWPGYNNGNQNFNTVYWAVDASFTPPVQGDTLVDDFQFQRGFSLNNRPPAGMVSWKTLNRGYRGHLWYAFTKAGPADTCFAIWTPSLPQAGTYEIFAYISLSNASAVTYKVNTLDGVQSVTVNQKSVSENWLSLGTFRLGVGSAGAVRLGDASTERGKELVFDAVRWSYRGGLNDVAEPGESPRPAEIRLYPNYPNPFNPSTTIRFELPSAARVRLEVVNSLGQVVAIPADGVFPAGMREVVWDAAGLPTGVYLLRLQGGREGGVRTRSMLLVR